MRILLTGATGYIGRRLGQRLVEEELQLRLFVRDPRKVQESIRPRVEIAHGSTFDTDSLRKAMGGVDVAYYLIHSMGAGEDFEKLDRISAHNFLEACIQAGVKRIVYLGGLGQEDATSRHLQSRMEVGEILSSRKEKIETIWFRASVIIGSGSASFEIIRNLVQKLPIMTPPRWVRTLTQPIAVDDVLDYLVAAKDRKVEGNLIVDIGSEIMTFQDMLKRTAEIMGLSRIVIPIPVLTPVLSSYWLGLITPVPMRVASKLIEGLKSETCVQNDNAKMYFPQIKPVSYETAVRRALKEIEEDQILSRWCDSSAGEVCDTLHEDIAKAVFVERRESDLVDMTPDEAYRRIVGLGGKKGWLRFTVLWRIWGAVDTLLGGYGLSRGRRDPNELRIGDSVDFWKVADLVEGKRLLLVSQIEFPGTAWLDFTIEDDKVIQTSYFYPNGVLGRVHWFLTHLLHMLVLDSLAKAIVES
ncbi:MAG: DUF2867 domain-containing protein [Methanobacteriota archaeon]|nr:MAG: DUF2867 domain-containing protein [Euryarchaeota archaeon]